MATKHKKHIPADALERYLKHEMTSKELAALTGYHPSYLRRAIERPRKSPKPTRKTKLIALRQAFRASIAHLPTREIAKQANVSMSTATRIKAKYARKQHLP